MQVSAEALQPRNARELFQAGADEVLMPCIGAIDDAIDKAARVAGSVTVHVPANGIADPACLLERLHEAGITRVLLVSGNPGHGRGTRTLYELIEMFRTQGLYVSVGAYPETYFRTTSDRHRSKSASILADKQAAGAQRVMTQASFSLDNMRKWLGTVRSAGVTLPLHVGVMPPVPGHTLEAVMREARAELFSHPRTQAMRKANLDMMFRMLWSHVSTSPEQFITEIGALDGMTPRDGFHIFGYGGEVAVLIRAGHAVGKPTSHAP